jgi:hypothetical protein
VAVAGINLSRVVEGRITEIWHVEENAGLMAQNEHDSGSAE